MIAVRTLLMQTDNGKEVVVEFDDDRRTTRKVIIEMTDTWCEPAENVKVRLTKEQTQRLSQELSDLVRRWDFK